MLEDLDNNVDTATFSHAMSDTLQLARRYKLSAYDAFLHGTSLTVQSTLGHPRRRVANSSKEGRRQKFP